YEVQDIMRGDEFKTRGMLQLLLDQCTEQLEVLLSDELGETPVLEKIRSRIEEMYGPREGVPEKIDLGRFVSETLEQLKSSFGHRNLHVSLAPQKTPAIWIPAEVLHKVIEGLLRNAIENTPDQGRVEVEIHNRGNSVQLKIQDSGVGIVEEHQKRIFEGFYPTQDTNAYSSRKPFDFNAGGKGADLLRMKIFSERYDFDLSINSTRCKALPGPGDVCPGAIDRCPYCKTLQDCYQAGGTCFAVCFPVSESDKGGQQSRPKTCRRLLGD
ncbi:MAG: HAMP domain-containing sensor histidine kinase, partial [Desulfobacterales bacterium]